jgi:hypothetical protein
MPSITQQPRNVDSLGPRRKWTLPLLLSLSLAITLATVVLNRWIRYTDNWDDLSDMLCAVMVAGVFWTIFILPLSVLLGAWWRRQRVRLLLTLTPAFAYMLLHVINLFYHPPTAAGRLQLTAQADLPASARDVEVHFWKAGFLVEFDDRYSFRCSAADTDRLILQMRMTLIDPVLPSYGEAFALAGLRDAEKKNFHAYWREEDEGGHFYFLITDATHEKVWMAIGCR